MAKKLVTFLLTFTLIACSSISIYATDSNEGAETEETITNSEQIEEEPSEEEQNKDEENKEDQEDKEEQDKEAAKKEAEAKKKEKLKNGLAAYIRKINGNVSKTKSKTMAGHFIEKGEKYDLDPKVLMAIAQNESTFYTNAKSPYGYKGLMQTSDSLARKYGYKPSSLYKAEVSIEVGAKYLSKMKKMFKTYTKALSAYAYGDGAVKSGNYSTALANKMLKTRNQITDYLEKNNYI